LACPAQSAFKHSSGKLCYRFFQLGGSIVLVNRAVKHKHIVVTVVIGKFTVERLYQLVGRIKLQVANTTFPIWWRGR
jgi:hypothetical protein